MTTTLIVDQCGSRDEFDKYDLGVVIVAHFDPPDAVERHSEWQQQHAGVLAQLPEADVRTNIGRAASGETFVTVRVADEWVDRFPD